MQTIAFQESEPVGDPVDVTVTPDGLVKSVRGDFLIDKAAFDRVNAAFEQHGVGIPFDYEHQTLGGEYASPDGTAPASGEIKFLKYVPGKGIIAAVIWTERARQMIRAREYLYSSPVVVIRDGKVVGLHSVGLTNKPAIVRMERVAAKETNVDKLPAGQRTLTKETETMELLKQMQDLIGGPTDTAETIVNKVGELKKKAETTDAPVATVKAVCSALGLKEDANADALVLSISTLKGEAAKGEGLVERLKKIEDDAAREKGQKKVDAYVAAHKLNPNDKPAYEAALRLACSSPTELDAILANAKPLVELGRTNPPEGGMKTGSGRDKELIANAVKAHNGKSKGSSLQRD
jgi:phage I-like protein